MAVGSKGVGYTGQSRLNECIFGRVVETLYAMLDVVVKFRLVLDSTYRSRDDLAGLG